MGKVTRTGTYLTETGIESGTVTHNPAEPPTVWCQTCGNPVENGQCACWCHLADALQRYLGMDFDASAQMAADLWEKEADREYVWSAEYADDHDVETYPDMRAYAPEMVREADKRAFPHDEDCPRCGRRQWGFGAADPVNPSDAEQETCGACGYAYTGEDTQ